LSDIKQFYRFRLKIYFGRKTRQVLTFFSRLNAFFITRNVFLSTDGIVVKFSREKNNILLLNTVANCLMTSICKKALPGEAWLYYPDHDFVKHPSNCPIEKISNCQWQMK
jgi:hypothetical protein